MRRYLCALGFRVKPSPLDLFFFGKKGINGIEWQSASIWSRFHLTSGNDEYHFNKGHEIEV